ncbi:MAG: MFS transporter [bacterium]|nr:MFS transporter [bacterium]
MSAPEKLPPGKQIAYAIGQFGWSTLVNTVNITLVYFYIPTADSGIPTFVTQAEFFVVLNVVTLLLASGRLFDAVTDPLIAGLSDRSGHKKGRRIPFLAMGAVPTGVFCALLFFPLVGSESFANLIWLAAIQFLFFLALTVYVTPYFALIAELGHSPQEKLGLSTAISVTYALGLIVASFTPAIGGALQSALQLDPVQGIQGAVTILAIFGVILMLVPVFFIDEKRYCRSLPSDTPIIESLMMCLRNKNFLPYAASDLTYFMGITIILTGMPYYVEVLVQLDKSFVGIVMTAIVLISFLFYFVVYFLAGRYGKRNLVLFAFLVFSGVFLLVYFLGNIPMDPTAQMLLVAVTAAMPMAFLGVLPNAILADIADHDSLKTGKKMQGMYYGARTFLQKFGVTAGLMVFAGLTNLGKDVGDDQGIRLSGIAGMALCLFAFFVFMAYNENKVLKETIELRGQAES